MQRTGSLESPWCWERLKAVEEGDNRWWDSWMASMTLWTWVWASFGFVMDRKAWLAAVHGFAKSQTRMSSWTDWLRFTGVVLVIDVFKGNFSISTVLWNYWLMSFMLSIMFGACGILKNVYSFILHTRNLYSVTYILDQTLEFIILTDLFKLPAWGITDFLYSLSISYWINCSCVFIFPLFSLHYT